MGNQPDPSMACNRGFPHDGVCTFDKLFDESSVLFSHFFYRISLIYFVSGFALISHPFVPFPYMASKT